MHADPALSRMAARAMDTATFRAERPEPEDRMRFAQEIEEAGTYENLEPELKALIDRCLVEAGPGLATPPGLS